MIIVGLGNPGEKFKNTRHNAGFMALDHFAEKNNFPEFELQKKYEALISDGIIENKKIILAKPQTFMNNSGGSIKKIVKSYSTKTLLLIHDDIDLPLGKIKIAKERGSAGHKGVESIVKAVGNKGLIRIRIGICPEKGKPKNRESFVIKKFAQEEKKLLSRVIDKASECLNILIKEGLEKAMNECNKQ
ncbi:MAG: aminoacyl-tRNA hydrolase [Candidatus Staskawiczbacteria bacterium]|nr:aminoacyl-tRNA hydrolase [Candidatus Staskawiczbacteria bacterium]